MYTGLHTFDKLLHWLFSKSSKDVALLCVCSKDMIIGKVLVLRHNLHMVLLGSQHIATRGICKARLCSITLSQWSNSKGYIRHTHTHTQDESGISYSRLEKDLPTWTAAVCPWVSFNILPVEKEREKKVWSRKEKGVASSLKLMCNFIIFKSKFKARRLLDFHIWYVYSRTVSTMLTFCHPRFWVTHCTITLEYVDFYMNVVSRPDAVMSGNNHSWSMHLLVVYDAALVLYRVYMKRIKPWFISNSRACWGDSFLIKSMPDVRLDGIKVGRGESISVCVVIPVLIIIMWNL